jgi:hypothetical protein
MKKRTNHYIGLSADYSRPGLVTPEAAQKLLEEAKKIAAIREPKLPEIGFDYTLEQIEQENKDWWTGYCEAVIQGRNDIISAGLREDLAYLCQDGPFLSLKQLKDREMDWWAIVAQPGVAICWPIVMFHGEHVYVEWKCTDNETNETIAKGNATLVRRGHRGGIYLQTEQLTFYRDVYASQELMKSFNITL